MCRPTIYYLIFLSVIKSKPLFIRLAEYGPELGSQDGKHQLDPYLYERYVS